MYLNLTILNIKSFEFAAKIDNTGLYLSGKVPSHFPSDSLSLFLSPRYNTQTFVKVLLFLSTNIFNLDLEYLFFSKIQMLNKINILNLILKINERKYLYVELYIQLYTYT